MITVSEYILARLKSLGVDHLFGIPGDFILPFFRAMEKSDVMHVAACNELNAGYAVDGYARLKGMGAAAVTYGPGSFSIVNAVAGAYAESVPMLVLSGAPETAVIQKVPQPPTHHVLPNNFEASREIFEKFTVYAERIDDAESAPAHIDEALQRCLAQKKPVYLEIPKNIQEGLCAEPGPLDIPPAIKSDEIALNHAVISVAERIKNSKRTVILPGHEIHRFNLQNSLIDLVKNKGLPFASMFTGKADYAEYLPECIGIYQGAGSLEEVKDFVEGADTVVFMGAVASDFNLGGGTAKLTHEQVISVFENEVSFGGATYSKVAIRDFMAGLLAALPDAQCKDSNPPVNGFFHKADTPYSPDFDAPISNKRFYDRMAGFFRSGDVILADAGSAVNITFLQLPKDTSYITSSYWASIGMGFGASFGACFAIGSDQRVIAVEGDGSFQMTAQELGSMTRYGKSPIVFIVNNKGYTAERLIHDGPFNDIADWKYHKLTEAFGGKGMEVHTEGDLETALEVAGNYDGAGPLVIEIHLDPLDASDAFRLMSEGLRVMD